jgi:hypothetical protein
LNPRIFNTKVKRAHPIDDFLAKERNKVQKTAMSDASTAMAKNAAIIAATSSRNISTGGYTPASAPAGLNSVSSLPKLKRATSSPSVTVASEKTMLKASTVVEAEDEEYNDNNDDIKSVKSEHERTRAKYQERC